MAKYGEGVVCVLGIPVIDSRLMEAVVAVSALAIASAVAWADWVISVWYRRLHSIADCA